MFGYIIPPFFAFSVLCVICSMIKVESRRLCYNFISAAMSYLLPYVINETV